MEQLIITPKTKIWDLLNTYPQLEDLLIEMAPPFKKLKNPVLRKTVARITTISQAAVIGNLNVEELVNKLRSEVGQNLTDVEADGGESFNTQKPGWFDAAKVVDEIDTRDMLHAGEHPVHVVLSGVKKLKKGEILKVIAPFLPAPLIEKASGLGSEHWVNQIEDELFEIYFLAPEG
jgi:uncharacterized protein (DUF2249 family)